MAGTGAPLTEDELAAWRALLRAHAGLLDVLEKELAENGSMPVAFYDVLVNLSEAGGRLRMSDLADQVLLSRSGVTRLVDRMVVAGLIDRDTCPSDRRGSYAVLTPAGKAALKRAWPAHAAGVAEHFAQHLKPGEARKLADMLGRIADATGRGEVCGGAG